MNSLLSSVSYRRSRPPHRRLVPCVQIDNYFFRDVARTQPLILMETTAYALKGRLPASRLHSTFPAEKSKGHST